MASKDVCEKCGGQALPGMRWCQQDANAVFTEFGRRARERDDQARAAREKGGKR